MFKIPIWGDIDGKTVKIILGKRYKISTNNNEFLGTISELKGESFLIKTVDGGFLINFDEINDIVGL